MWEVHDRDKKGTTFLYELDAEGNVTDVDVEYPKAEAARRKRQGKEADRKVAAALRRGHRNDESPFRSGPDPEQRGPHHPIRVELTL